MTKQEIIDIGLSTINTELSGLRALKKYIGPNFVRAVQLIKSCKGRIICTGMGKSGIIARKIAATFSSTGTSAFYFNPAEGIHGDLGSLLKEDIVLALSKSGASQELVNILPFIKRRNLSLISMTANQTSILAKNSTVVLLLPDTKEACPYNLAPTTSTTLQLVLGDALAIALLKEKRFTQNDFALLHPGGSLGMQLMSVEELMHTGDSLPLVYEHDTMKKVLHEIVDKKLGVAIVVNSVGKLKGIIVDGDFKRILLKNKTSNFFKKTAKDFMTKNPKTISHKKLVVEALSMMQGVITSLIVVNKSNKPIGLIHIHDIVKKGFL